MTDSLTQDLVKEAMANAGHAYIRPKDAATLLVLDRSGAEVRVLMGRRHMRHAFMPGKFVFPGGRVDPGDSRVKVAGAYHPAVEEKLAAQHKGRASAARIRAFTVAAIRETYEEAGLFIGRHTGDRWPAKGDFEAFSERGILPDLEPMRMVARAITPPGRPRRFDTRFLAVWSDAIVDRLPEGTGPSGELEDVAWVTLDEAKRMELPAITLKVLDDLHNRLREDPELSPGAPVPFYYRHGAGFAQDLI